jgi:hypothetical protein
MHLRWASTASASSWLALRSPALGDMGLASSPSGARMKRRATSESSGSSSPGLKTLSSDECEGEELR